MSKGSNKEAGSELTMGNPVSINHLKEKEGTRCVFTGECVSKEIDYGYLSVNEMLLLKDIKDESDQIVTKYQWFNMAKGFSKANLSPGDIVEFSGKVEKNTLGKKKLFDGSYSSVKDDFKISFPSKVRKVAGLTDGGN
jgi:hypothetical protein